MIVTVGGQAASGKSTLAKALVELTGYKHISAGELMRDMAEEKSMTLVEFSEYAEAHPEVDREIDVRQKKLAVGDCIVDGRLSAHVLDADLSIWLIAPAKIRAERVVKRGEKYSTVDEAQADMNARDESERKRYIEFYKIDLENLSKYDLIINTACFGIKQMIEVSMSAIKSIDSQR